MELYLLYIVKKWKLMVLFMTLGVALAVALSFLRPWEYTSSIRLLIVQKNTGTSDAYTVLKSAESIGENLSQVVRTSSFLDKILDKKYSVDKNFFPRKEYDRRKKWNRMIETQVSRGTGFLKITVYHQDKIQAHNMMRATANILIEEGWQYVGTAMEMKLVDKPLESKFPARPNIFAHMFLGLFFGACAGVLYIVSKQKMTRAKI
jgi:capsular polysaccharide biosynthesis protein